MDPTITIFLIPCKEAFQGHSCNDRFLLASNDTDEGQEEDDSKDHDSNYTTLHRPREQTPLIQTQDLLYAFRTSDTCRFSSSGWVFGSNSDRCDFLLAENNKTGVSGRHFSLEVDKRARVLLLRNWSGHKTKVVTDTGRIDVSTMMVINKSAIIQAGLVEISVRFPCEIGLNVTRMRDIWISCSPKSTKGYQSSMILNFDLPHSPQRHLGAISPTILSRILSVQVFSELSILHMRPLKRRVLDSLL